MSGRPVSKSSQFPLPPSLPVDAFPPEAQFAIAEFNRMILDWYYKLNGHISLGTPNAWSGHIDGEWIDVTVPASNTDFPVSHHLGRIPDIGFLVADGGVLTRQSTTPANTESQVWLRSTAAAGSVFRILVV